MKYNPTMKAYWKDIADTIQRMTTPHQLDYVKKLAEDSDSRLLLDWFKDNFGKLKVSKCGEGYDFECTPQNLKILYDHKINNSGDDFLTSTWAQLVAFIQGNKNFVFDKSEDSEEEPEQSGKEISDNIPKIGSYVEENMLGDELTFDEIANMVGEIIVCDHSTESRSWYKVVKVEKIIDGSDGKRHLRLYDGSKQRGTVNEIFFDKSQRRPQRAWRLKIAQASDFPCDKCALDDNGCCNYPDTPDDYCVCGDKQVPIAVEDNSPAFDYSELDNDTAVKLQKISERVIDIKKKYILDTAKEVYATHELLANHYGGKFGSWCESVGITRQTGASLINVVKIFDNITSEEQQTLSKLKPSLLYEVSKPSAPPELVEQVKSGDITTHKDYITLKKQLEEANKRADNAEAEVERAEKRAEDAEFHKKRCQEGFDSVADQSKKNYHKYLDEYHKNQDLEKRIRELESKSDSAEKDKKIAELKKELQDLEERHDDDVRHSCELEKQIKMLENRPVEMAVEDNSEELSRKDEEIAELREQLERLSDDNVKSLVFRMTFEEYDRLIGIVKASDDYALQNIVKNARSIKI